MASSWAEILDRHGASGEALAIALGIIWGESNGYADAVGDIGIVDSKWGPSVGACQVRVLRDPTAWGVADRVRDIRRLRDPDYQIHAMQVISSGWTVWTPWSAYGGTIYTQKKGVDLPIRWGHSQAERWNLDALSWADVAAIRAEMASLRSISDASAARVAVAEGKVAAMEARLADLAADYARISPGFRTLADALDQEGATP